MLWQPIEARRTGITPVLNNFGKERDAEPRGGAIPELTNYATLYPITKVKDLRFTMPNFSPIK